MAEVVLFHHAQGLTPGVIAFADELRGAGHTVHTPDLYDGRTFATLEEGIAYAGEIGFGEVLERGVRAVEGLPASLVYAGFSLGVMPAQKLAQTRAGARGALLFYSCFPVSEFGAAWPDGVPVQIHGMDADPFFADEGDIDAARALVAEAKDAELFLYPGDGHLFADSSLPAYDPDAAALLRQRVLRFLQRIGLEDGAPATYLDEQGRYLAEQGYPEPPIAADESATLLSFLERQRATFAWKCGGLDAAGLRATLSPSSMTLGGMLKHMARFEDNMSFEWLRGRGQQPPWDRVDWAVDRDWDWRTAAEDSPEQLYTGWQEAVARSRSLIAEGLADGGLEQPARGLTNDQGEAPTLRYVLLNMIEEYARHNGHADLIRESVDGLVGHDPSG